MVIKRCVMVTATLVALSVPVASQATTGSGASPACDIDVAMQERRTQAVQRSSDINRVGIQEPNTTILDNLPAVNTGACLDQVYQVMDAIGTQIGGSMSSIFRTVAGDKLARMGCRRVRQYYNEVMNTELGRFGDELGILRNGEIGEYREGRTTRVDVRDAIRLGRQAKEAMSSVPQGPIGRTPPASTNTAPANREGLNNAIQGL